MQAAALVRTHVHLSAGSEIQTLKKEAQGPITTQLITSTSKAHKDCICDGINLEQPGRQQASPPRRPREAGGGKSVQKRGDDSEGALVPCRADCRRSKSTSTAKPLSHRLSRAQARCTGTAQLQVFPISNGPRVWVVINVPGHRGCL